MGSGGDNRCSSESLLPTRPMGRGEEKHGCFGVSVRVHGWGPHAQARMHSHSPGRSPGFLQTVHTMFSLGKVFWIADPRDEEEAADARELPGAAWERTVGPKIPPNAYCGVPRGGGRDPRIWGAGEFGVDNRVRRAERNPFQKKYTDYFGQSKAQERGAGGGAPKSSVPESRRKPDAPNFGDKQKDLLGVKFRDDSRGPSVPRFQKCKGETMPLIFRVG